MMKAVSKHPVLTLIINLVLNVLLAYFLISILLGGVLRYEVGFVVNIPMIVLLGYYLVLPYIVYFNGRHPEIRSTLNTIILIFLGLIVVFVYLFNLFCWIELFDGKTNALLP
ncbi:hypothetical protein [Carboxylicivirga sp. M1479]|uniref:hypothetical protein n=1 Tax=Carboxylicivirga sp. M1479 TaxID=2594476 RepID=UPI0011776E15|nr:hypothetical protein [Carboxylicivirga sp. M1479]TRX72399.1 hypothetical protein FNN09_00215 [Carboxylicivirga sp. M1479]